MARRDESEGGCRDRRNPWHRPSWRVWVDHPIRAHRGLRPPSHLRHRARTPWQPIALLSASRADLIIGLCGRNTPRWERVLSLEESYFMRKRASIGMSAFLKRVAILGSVDRIQRYATALAASI